MTTLSPNQRTIAWIRDHLVWLWPIAAIVFVLVVFWLRPSPAPIPRAEEHALDSLTITRPMFTAHVDTLTRVESVYVRQSTQATHQATITQHAADSLNALATAAQRVAEAAGDTLSQWRVVALLRGAEADSLRASTVELRLALSTETAARTSADDRASATMIRLAASEQLNQRLAADVQRGDHCRIAWVLSCPSRKTAAIGGVLLGAGGAILISRRLVP